MKNMDVKKVIGSSVLTVGLLGSVFSGSISADEYKTFGDPLEVLPDHSFDVEFNMAMDESSINGDTVRVVRENGKEVELNLRINTSNTNGLYEQTSFKAMYDGDFNWGEEVTFYLEDGIESEKGVPLASGVKRVFNVEEQKEDVKTDQELVESMTLEEFKEEKGNVGFNFLTYKKGNNRNTDDIREHYYNDEDYRDNETFKEINEEVTAGYIDRFDDEYNELHIINSKLSSYYMKENPDKIESKFGVNYSGDISDYLLVHPEGNKKVAEIFIDYNVVVVANSDYAWIEDVGSLSTLKNGDVYVDGSFLSEFGVSKSGEVNLTEFANSKGWTLEKNEYMNSYELKQ